MDKELKQYLNDLQKRMKDDHIRFHPFRSRTRKVSRPTTDLDFIKRDLAAIRSGKKRRFCTLDSLRKRYNQIKPTKFERLQDLREKRQGWYSQEMRVF